MSEAAAPVWMEWVTAPLVLLAADAATVLALNATARDLFGALALPALPCALADLIGATAAGTVRALGEPGAPAPGSAVVEARVGGKPRTLGLGLARVEAPAGHLALTLQDRLSEAQAAAYISTLQEDFRGILESLPVGVEIYDARGQCIFTNSQFEVIFGYGVDELDDLDEWWRTAYPDPAYRELARRTWDDAIAASRTGDGEVVQSDWLITCKDGSQKLVHFRFRPIADGHVVAYWDVSEQRRLERELRELADTDMLTGLRNRRSFFEDAAAALEDAAAAGHPVSVLMIDLDHFKTVNDRHGHAVGDAVLRAVAQKCGRALRERDVLARLGGEEFVVLLPATGRREAQHVAERLLRFIGASPVEAGEARMRLTVSVGGVTSEAAPHDLDQLLGAADNALYAAKHGGRNRVHFAGDDAAGLPPGA